MTGNSPRVLPAPDTYATCPNEGTLLDYYAGVFDAVYIALNPFVRQSRPAPEGMAGDWRPTDAELLRHFEPVTWMEVMKLSSLPTLEAVDIGLGTQILGLSEANRNVAYASTLATLYPTIEPTCEGVPSPFLYAPVLGIFKELGHDWVWGGDAMCTERKLYWIDDLIADPASSAHIHFFSPDKSLLWATHWDSHCTFLCGPRRALERVGVTERLEGFFCTPATQVYWSLGQR